MENQKQPQYVDCAYLTASRLVFKTLIVKEKYSWQTSEEQKTGVKINPTTKQFHNFELSKQASKTLIDRISFMYQLAKSRYKKTSSGKEIFNFKMSFFTLTLPSEQKHPTAKITKDCLNQFWIELQKKYNVVNYVWRLEFQKNGNVHYHCVSDSYVDYLELQTIWNRCIAKLGYVRDFQKKFEKMSWLTYYNLYHKNGVEDAKQLAKRYMNGKNSGWSAPPTVDVKSATSNKSVSLYIAKYFLKKEKTGVKNNPLDNEENSKSMRLWYCSNSVSRLSSIQIFLDDWRGIVADAIAGDTSVKEVFTDWCRIIYFQYQKLATDVKAIFQKIIQEHRQEINYTPAY